jgi:tetratricopeptide (TPR) repeat protein
VTDWSGLAEREAERYRDGEARVADIGDPDPRQRQLTRMGNAAYGAGLACSAAGERESAVEWFDRAATRYRESWKDAPPGSWGRPIGAIKARLLAGDAEGAAAAAEWALAEGAADADSPIGRYAAALALLVLGRDDEARVLADGLRTRDAFPHDVGDALATIAARDRVGYTDAIESVLRSFETRDEYLEDVPIADTVVVLQALASERDLAADVSSPLLPF